MFKITEKGQVVLMVVLLIIGICICVAGTIGFCYILQMFGGGVC